MEKIDLNQLAKLLSERMESNLKAFQEKEKPSLSSMAENTNIIPEKHEHDTPKGHKSVEDVADCPTCHQKLLGRFRPELYKEFKEKIKSKELVTCLDCGEIVDVKESNCPTCKGTRAK